MPASNNLCRKTAESCTDSAKSNIFVGSSTNFIKWVDFMSDCGYNEFVTTSLPYRAETY